MISLLPLITSADPAVRDQSLDASCRAASVAELLAGPGSRGRPVFVEDLKEHLHRLGRDRDLGPPDAGVGVVDVALASYVLDPSRRDHSIDALVRDRLGRTLESEVPNL